MKQLPYLLIAFTLFAFAACKKSDPTAPAATAAAGSFTCTIGGVAFVADSAHYSKNATQTFMEAWKGGVMRFEINLAGVTATTYNVLMGTNDFIYWPSTNYSGGTSGSVIISAYDNTANQITGTFTTIGTTGPGGAFAIANGVFTKLPKR
ncbi:MAG: hypothetical protein NTX08_01945 [Sphingobacteriales bacterium]|nr:hypothetical protein [Sphingobacteriales bacterium]